MFRRSIPALVILALCATGGVARAQDTRAPSDENREVATALFKEGRRLMEAGDVPGACRKFEESQRLDPSGGTLLNLAACHEREGRTASAWTEFSAALAQARKDGRADRVDVAQERVAALEPHLARLTIVVKEDGQGRDLEVLLDGVDVRKPAWGMALPVDPGPHVAEARATGFEPWHGSITIKGDGDTQTVEIPRLVLLPPAPAPEPTPTSLPVAAEAPPSRSPLLRDAIMVGAAVLGVAGIGVGSYLGLHAISLERTAKGGCPNGRCTDDAAATSQGATTNADFSTGAFAIGAAGLAAAGVLFFTRGHAASSPVEAVVTPSSASLLLTGAF